MQRDQVFDLLLEFQMGVKINASGKGRGKYAFVRVALTKIASRP